jgi:hypothetical protein
LKKKDYNYVLIDSPPLSVIQQVHVYGGSNKASKSICPTGKPEGNIAHRVHCAVSPEIVLMGDYNTQVFVVQDLVGI